MTPHRPNSAEALRVEQTAPRRLAVAEALRVEQTAPHRLAVAEALRVEQTAPRRPAVPEEIGENGAWCNKRYRRRVVEMCGCRLFLRMALALSVAMSRPRLLSISAAIRFGNCLN